MVLSASQANSPRAVRLSGNLLSKVAGSCAGFYIFALHSKCTRHQSVESTSCQSALQPRPVHSEFTRAVHSAIGLDSLVISHDALGPSPSPTPPIVSLLGHRPVTEERWSYKILNRLPAAARGPHWACECECVRAVHLPTMETSVRQIAFCKCGLNHKSDAIWSQRRAKLLDLILPLYPILAFLLRQTFQLLASLPSLLM